MSNNTKIILGVLIVLIIIRIVKRSRENGLFKTISMDEAKEIFKKPGNYVIVDARTASEFSQGHIPKAINIPNETIGKTEPKKLPDKNKAIYVYCLSGARARSACVKLAKMGYTNITYIGALRNWTGKLK